jgi:hypothetical protein
MIEGFGKWEYNIDMERYRIAAEVGWYDVILNKAKMISENYSDK